MSLITIHKRQDLRRTNGLLERIALALEALVPPAPDVEEFKIETIDRVQEFDEEEDESVGIQP